MEAKNEFLEILDLLEQNKKFPYYAAERRIDLFVTYYATRILGDFFDEQVVYVAPEFPIKHTSNYQANKADLLCAFKQTKQPIIVEVKTDGKSFKRSQMDDYADNISSWVDMVSGISSMTKNSQCANRVKYFHLMQSLVDNGLCYYNTSCDSQSLVTDIIKLIEKDSRCQKSDRSRKINILAESLRSKWREEAVVLYLAPDEIIDNIANVRIKNMRFMKFSDIKKMDGDSKEYVHFVNFIKNIS